MKKLTRFATKYWGILVVAAALALSTSLLLSPQDSSADGSITPWEIVGAVVLVLLLVAVFATFVLRLAGADSESPVLARAAIGGAASQALLERWLRRSRYYRFMGGFVAFIVGLPLLPEDSDFAGVVFVTFIGVAAGGALAEFHVLRRDNARTAVANLAARTIGDYVTRVDMIAAIVLALGGAAVLIASAIGFGAQGSARWAVITVVALVAMVGMQRIVVTRSRPALKPELRQVDDLLRFLAATQGFGRPAIALAFFMLSISIAKYAPSDLAEVVSFTLMIAGLYWWYRGRPGRVPKLARQALNA